MNMDIETVIAHPTSQLEKWLRDNGFLAAIFLGRTKHAVRSSPACSQKGFANPPLGK